MSADGVVIWEVWPVIELGHGSLFFYAKFWSRGNVRVEYLHHAVFRNLTGESELRFELMKRGIKWTTSKDNLIHRFWYWTVTLHIDEPWIVAYDKWRGRVRTCRNVWWRTLYTICFGFYLCLSFLIGVVLMNQSSSRLYAKYEFMRRWVCYVSWYCWLMNKHCLTALVHGICLTCHLLVYTKQLSMVWNTTLLLTWFPEYFSVLGSCPWLVTPTGVTVNRYYLDCQHHLASAIAN